MCINSIYRSQLQTVNNSMYVGGGSLWLSTTDDVAWSCRLVWPELYVNLLRDAKFRRSTLYGAFICSVKLLSQCLY